MANSTLSEIDFSMCERVPSESGGLVGSSSVARSNAMAPSAMLSMRRRGLCTPSLVTCKKKTREMQDKYKTEVRNQCSEKIAGADLQYAKAQVAFTVSCGGHVSRRRTPTVSIRHSTHHCIGRRWRGGRPRLFGHALHRGRGRSCPTGRRTADTCTCCRRADTRWRRRRRRRRAGRSGTDRRSRFLALCPLCESLQPFGDGAGHRWDATKAFESGQKMIK